MRDLDVVIPESMEQCLEALERYAGDAVPVAGGTDLRVLMRAGVKEPPVVVWLGSLADLKYVREDSGEISIGPIVTHAEVARAATLDRIASLRKAAGAVGSPQIRNVGTAGGNLANASPAADLYPPLLTLDADVVVKSRRGDRTIRLEDFAEGPGETGLGHDEILGSIRFEAPPQGTYTDFSKLGLRNAVAISVANCAIYARATGGRFDEVRIACGAVAPKAIRMRAVEGLLRGEELTAGLLKEVEAATSRICDPITDLRASADYRRRVAGVLVSRLVGDAWSSLTGKTSNKGEAR